VVTLSQTALCLNTLDDRHEIWYGTCVLQALCAPYHQCECENGSSMILPCSSAHITLTIAAICIHFLVVACAVKGSCFSGPTHPPASPHLLSRILLPCCHTGSRVYVPHSSGPSASVLRPTASMAGVMPFPMIAPPPPGQLGLFGFSLPLQVGTPSLCCGLDGVLSCAAVMLYPKGGRGGNASRVAGGVWVLTASAGKGKYGHLACYISSSPALSRYPAVRSRFCS
jgi:hypothetical protein